MWRQKCEKRKSPGCGAADAGRSRPAQRVPHAVSQLVRGACVSGKARDRLHKRGEEEHELKRVPEVVFDYAFLGSEVDGSTILLMVARDRRKLMIFAHVCVAERVVARTRCEGA